MKKLNILIDRLMYPISYKFGVIETKLIMSWKKILHEPLSMYSRPCRILFDKYSKYNTLYISANSGSIALEIQYLIPILLEKIAVIFGYKVIHKIKIKQEMGYIN